MEHRTCDWCGAGFPATRKNRRCCSSLCSTALWRRNGSNKSSPSFIGPPRPCVECGVYLENRRADARHCSPECYSRAYLRENDLKVKQAARKRRLTRGQCSIEGCTTIVSAAGLCGMHTERLRRHGSLDLPDLYCGDCGTGPLLRKGNCPPQFCRKCYCRRSKESSSYSNHMRRTVYAVGDKITIAELGERDGWRCHLCGKKVRKRTGQDRLSPSIDHLIPVSSDGAHVWENVALAHKGCNSSRNNRGAAQLRLIA